MFSTFTTSHSTEATSLIMKHGVTNALFIMNLGYFTNTRLAKVGDQGFVAMNTGVRKIASGSKDRIGLTPSEYRILAFWSNHLGSTKVPFLAEHAHTIYEARGKTRPYSKNDLESARSTEKILDLEYEMRTEGGLARLLTGREKPKGKYRSGGERMTARAHVPDPLFINGQDIDKITDPKLISSLAGTDMAISRIKVYRERLNGEKTRIDNAKTLCHKKEFADKRLNTLNEKRQYLKSQKQ
ncbi:hypothetical protein FOXB_06890 [Fusarium oxysporum f. sp. conglutinans Fo5176]|uniref:Uncharacterized protein n=2 Tax=Fusarium oxysporum f. sp. conglutinans TaxID=100902 RepID=F9FKG1_FUSOF|nr:hypothetical protein FOXB_06890 [Fusarium oxysporum f. sp. conglutinans Fo5176]